MKQNRTLFVVFVLVTMLLSACGAGTSQTDGGKVKPDINATSVSNTAGTSPTHEAQVAADMIVTGVIESMDGTQWVVNGQTFTVDPTVVRDVTYKVGATVKLEGKLQADGRVLVSGIQTAGPDDLATETPNQDDFATATRLAVETSGPHDSATATELENHDSNDDNGGGNGVGGDDNGGGGGGGSDDNGGGGGGGNDDNGGGGGGGG